MGIERTYAAKYFRKRAEEFREKADNCQIDQTKRALRKVAATYEALANRAEQIRAARDLRAAE